MGPQQIVKRHMMNQSFHNAQNSDRKLVLKNKPIIKPISLKEKAKMIKMMTI